MWKPRLPGAPSGVLLPVGAARFVVSDLAENQSRQQNAFAAGSFPAPVSFAAGAAPLFPAGATFRQTTPAVNLCFDAEVACAGPAVRTVTLTATAAGPSGIFQNPFGFVLFAYVDNIDVGGGESGRAATARGPRGRGGGVDRVRIPMPSPPWITDPSWIPSWDGSTCGFPGSAAHVRRCSWPP